MCSFGWVWTPPNVLPRRARLLLQAAAELGSARAAHVPKTWRGRATPNAPAQVGPPAPSPLIISKEMVLICGGVEHPLLCAGCWRFRRRGRWLRDGGGWDPAQSDDEGGELRGCVERRFAGVAAHGLGFPPSHKTDGVLAPAEGNEALGAGGTKRMAGHPLRTIQGVLYAEEARSVKDG